uniref:Uncharacterized protein n=1 Tax=Romanomermis culicivorax TaxID=13658 RepID=A0A915L2B3_ROMCU
MASMLIIRIIVATSATFIHSYGSCETLNIPFVMQIETCFSFHRQCSSAPQIGTRDSVPCIFFYYLMFCKYDSLTNFSPSIAGAWGGGCPLNQYAAVSADAKSVSKITPLAINERTSKVISDIMIDRRPTNVANATINKKKGRRSKDKQTVGKPRASGMINPNGQSTPKKRRSAGGTFGCHPTEEFRCHSNGKCILNQKLCDYYEDCEDGSDEIAKVCGIEKCEEHEWRCNNDRQCINKNGLCDGTPDCEDGSDERGCWQLERADMKLILASLSLKVLSA